MEIILLVIVGLGLMMWMSSRGQKKQQEQLREMQSQMVPGVWVRTTSGFYGIISDFDGDVVILQTPGGEESYWDRRAVMMVIDNPPFAPDEDLEIPDNAEDLVEEAGESATAQDEPASENPRTVSAQESPASDEPVENATPTDAEAATGETAEAKADEILEEEENVKGDPDDLWDDSFTRKKSDGESR